nr:hypothetical protein CFP56_18271 [Quercus suber]
MDNHKVEMREFTAVGFRPTPHTSETDVVRSPAGVNGNQGNVTDPHPSGAKLMGRDIYEDNHKDINVAMDQLILGRIVTQKETDASMREKI